jgi:hypothetical protein
MSEQDGTTDAAAPVDQAATPEPPKTDEPLGEGGKKALQAEREARRQAEKEAAEFRARIEALEQAASKTDEERAALLKSRNERLVAAEIRAAAKGVLQDPADALTFISPTSFEVSDDGSVAAEAIEAAISDLATRKPYLAVRHDQPRFEGGADAGPRTTPPPKSLDDEIAEASAAGDVRRVISLQNQKLASLAG